MGVFTFASLKGGVGKTSLSVNISHAYAKRGCRVLLIDCDPSAHATRFFQPHRKTSQSSPLARLLLSKDRIKVTYTAEGFRPVFDEPLFCPVRPYFDLLASGKELNHFLWGKGAKVFRRFFPTFIRELQDNYDHVIIDTSPDYNVVTRTVLGCSDLVTVPVDSSRMSIDSLEEIVANARHIEGPTWAIVRTMLNRQASRVQRLSAECLKESINLQQAPFAYEDECIDEEFEDTESFINMLHEREQQEESSDTGSNRPIYLLDSVIARTEQQNRISFLGKTALDTRSTRQLGNQYTAVAKELEDLLAACCEYEQETDFAECFNQACPA